MALVIGKLGMINEGGQNLHPFFTQSKVPTNCQPAESIDPSPHLPAKPIASPDNSLLPDTTSLNQPQRRRKNGNKRHNSAAESGTQATGTSPAKAVFDDQKSNWVEETERNSINHSIIFNQEHTATDLQPDLNGSRRKRQRTASPNQEAPRHVTAPLNPWQEQLTAAAFGGNLDNATEPKGLPASPVHLKVSKPTWKEVQTNTFTQEDDDGKPFPGRSLANSPHKELSSTDSSSSNLLQQAQRTSSIRMLKVRSDGKLASPKSKSVEFVSGQKPKRRSRQTKIKPQKWVVLRFGVDAESRRLMAQKIDRLISNPVNTACTEFDSDLARSTPKALVPAGPPKPTHPFFLGSSAQQLNPKTVMPSNDEIKTANVKGGEIAVESAGSRFPTAKQAANPKKSASAWAAFGGFGSRSLAETDRIMAKTQGAQEPLWPSHEMSHIRGIVGPFMDQAPDTCRQLADVHKLKEVKISIAEHDNVLHPLVQMVHAYRLDGRMMYSQYSETVRRHKPKRRIMTGRQLQRAIYPSLSYRSAEQTQSPQVMSRHKDELNDVPFSQAGVHPAIREKYDKLANSLTAFDKCECETHEWAQKHAPRCAANVLQQGPEVMLIREWLQSIRVSSVSNSVTGIVKIRRSSDASKRHAKVLKRKRRKKTGDLDGFLVSSDDEANELEELPDFLNLESAIDGHLQSRRSLIRTGGAVNSPHNGEQGKTTNAVIVSGPHGCGKTAAIYAVAEELGFEVFEINAGSRRNGKDLMEKVGDMSQNHLVHRARNIEVAVNDAIKDSPLSGEESTYPSEALKRDLASGRQGTVNSFFRPKPATKKNKSKGTPEAPGTDAKKNQKGERNKRQSLVLLEEVDVLFEEDKQFWAATLDFLLQSKRPIIMTCTDETLLPWDQMRLHAIFRFSTPPEELAIDYLLLVAANEGHLLSRDAISILYRYKKHDLRASLVELNFFCQMAVGDKKGGLEWMLIRSSPGECLDENGEQLRVVSEGTYREGMGLLACDRADLPPGTALEQETDLVAATWNDYDIDLEDYLGFSIVIGLPHTNPASRQARQARLSRLETFEQTADSLSATDTFPGFGFRRGLTASLDPSLPELTDKIRANFDNSATLLNATPKIEQSQISTSLALTLRVCANRVFAHDYHGLLSCPISETVVRKRIIEASENCHSEANMTRSGITATFDPIARPAKGSSLSSFDGPLSMVVEDLAPYVRGIVYYDVRLEEQRLRLSSLLSEGARNGKKIRTTRASRAALEGGSKAHTRRERWFPKETNFTHILRSGGEEWQQRIWHDIAQDSLDGELGFDKSRRSSMVSGTGSEI